MISALLVILALQFGPAPPVPVDTGVFHHCGVDGQTTEARIRPLNVLKNRATAPHDFNSAVTLERLSAAGEDRDRWSTDQAAIITGLVVDVKPGGLESVNCGATELQLRDTHIGIAVDQAHAKTPVIVEVSPRWRAAVATLGIDWSTATLRQALLGHQVTIAGWLFRDDEHLQNAVNTNPHGTTLWRQTAWELHPVTAIEVLPTPAVPARPRRR